MVTKQLTNSNTFLLGFIFLIIFSSKILGQSSLNSDKRLFVKIALGAGIGTGYPKQDNSFGLED
jgi:hypothetical protein